jgi:flagellin FlaB
MLKRFLGKEKGITGLETAIILIAFIVVAAVFAYTALSAGLFSTQISDVLGGESMDFTPPTSSSSNNGICDSTSKNRVVINYSDSYQTVTNLYWIYTPLGITNGNDILETGEKFQITIGSVTAGTAGGNLIDALTTKLTSNKTFTLQIVTAAGAVLIIERTTPPYIDTIMDLH